MTAYELALDEALRARAERSKQLRSAMEQAMGARDTERQADVQDQMMQASIAVREVNDRAIDSIAGAFGERGGHAEAVASGIERAGAQGQPVGHPPGGNEGAVLLQQGEGLGAAAVVQGKAGTEQVVAELVLGREAPAWRLGVFGAGPRGIAGPAQGLRRVQARHGDVGAARGGGDRAPSLR